jgi:hypothetical protein
MVSEGPEIVPAQYSCLTKTLHTQSDTDQLLLKIEESFE